MNQGPVMMQNPAYVEEEELDEDEVDPADLAPLVSGDSPIVTVPDLKEENVVEDLGEDVDEDEEIQVDVWYTGKTREQEYRLHPDPSIDEISSRLFNQVWDLLQILQERVDQQTCNNKDIKLIDGLKAISVMHARLSKLTEKALKR